MSWSPPLAVAAVFDAMSIVAVPVAISMEVPVAMSMVWSIDMIDIFASVSACSAVQTYYWFSAEMRLRVGIGL